MKAVKKTGLVPVKSHQTGGIFGVPPARARELLKAKQVRLVPIPSDIETVDLDDPKPEVKAAEVDDRIDIPEDWENLHHLQKIKLARDIKEDFEAPEGMTPTEAAEEVIRAELQNRGD